MLEGCPILVLILILEHREVAVVPAFGNVMLLYRFQNGTARLVGMGAIREAAVFRELEYLSEIACKLFPFDVERSETFNARRINQVAPLWQF